MSGAKIGAFILGLVVTLWLVPFTSAGEPAAGDPAKPPVPLAAKALNDQQLDKVEGGAQLQVNIPASLPEFNIGADGVRIHTTGDGIKLQTPGGGAKCTASIGGFTCK